MEKKDGNDRPVSLTAREMRGIIRSRAETYGKSRLGAPLEIFLPEKAGTGCLVLAGQHGTEPEGTVLLSSVLRSIPAGDLESAVATCLNPDGIMRGTRGNAAGVDLNRNFPTKNWAPDQVFHSWNNENPMDTGLSPGACPLSEPETAAVIALVEKINPRVIISIHAPLGCIDDPRMSPLGEWLSRETGLPLVEDIGYATPGSFGTWAIEKGLHLITFELPIDSVQNHRRNFTPPLLKILTGRCSDLL